MKRYENIDMEDTQTWVTKLYSSLVSVEHVSFSTCNYNWGLQS